MRDPPREAPNLNRAEHDLIVRVAVNAGARQDTGHRGTGSNSTSQAIELGRDASRRRERHPVGRALLHKPTQSGMYAIFAPLPKQPAAGVAARRAARTVCGLADDTIARSPSGAVRRAARRHQRPHAAAALAECVGSGLSMLSGDDATALAFFAQAATGCISVVANWRPAFAGMYLAWTQRHTMRARQLATMAVDDRAALAARAIRRRSSMR